MIAPLGIHFLGDITVQNSSRPYHVPSGPGETKGGAGIGCVDDHIIVKVKLGQHRIELFQLPAGQLLRALEVRIIGIGVMGHNSAHFQSGQGPWPF